MDRHHRHHLVSLIFLTIFWSFEAESAASSCPTFNLSSRPCLDVFSHAPANLPKCYCTNICDNDLVTFENYHVDQFVVVVVAAENENVCLSVQCYC
jgi:hypothetical protein